MMTKDKKQTYKSQLEEEKNMEINTDEIQRKRELARERKRKQRAKNKQKRKRKMKKKNRKN